MEAKQKQERDLKATFRQREAESARIEGVQRDIENLKKSKVALSKRIADGRGGGEILTAEGKWRCGR